MKLPQEKIRNASHHALQQAFCSLWGSLNGAREHHEEIGNKDRAAVYAGALKRAEDVLEMFK